MAVQPTVDLFYSGESIPIMQDGFLGLIYLERSDGFSLFKLRVRSSNWSKYDVLVRIEEPAKMQFGLIKDGVRIMSPQKKLFVSRARYHFDPTGLEMQISGMDWGWKELEGVDSSAWSNKRVSEIVQDIAESRKLEFDITKTEGTFSIRRATLDAAKFISRRLLPLAFTSKRFDFRFFFQNGEKLCFKPLNEKPDRVYRYYRNTQATPADGDYCYFLDAVFDRVGVAERSGWATEYRGYNPATKKGVNSVMNLDSGATKLAKRVTTIPDPQIVNVESIPFPEPDNYRDSDVESIAKARYARETHRLMRVSFIVPLDPTLTVGGSVMLDILNQDGEPTAWAGAYFIDSVRHVIAGERFYTAVIGCRQQFA